MKFKTSVKLLFLLTISFTISCAPPSAKSGINSYGYFGELAIFTDKNTFDHPVMNRKSGDKISDVERVFEEDQEFYVNSEPYFTCVKREFGGAGQAAKMMVNVLVLVNAEHKKDIEGYIKSLGFNIDSLAETDDSYMIERKNVWAKPQTVIFLFAKNTEQLTERLESQAPLLRTKFLDSEKQDIGSRVLDYDTAKSKVARLTAKMFGLELPLPQVKLDDYRIGKQTDDFVWYKFQGKTGLKSEGKDYLMNFAIMKRPYLDSAQFNQQNIDSFINAQVKLNIPGPMDTVYIELDNRIDAYPDIIRIDGVYTKRIKHWWHYANAFGGGPFTSYTFYHGKTRQLITCAAFFYGPQVEKSKYMRELEASIEKIKLRQ